MERSRNFYKAIRLGYILISILIGCIAYNSFYEWQEIEALELDNKKIDEFRKEINNINIQMIKFSLFGETILEWNDKDIEHYHAQRMAMDSMLCRFKATYPAERIDSVRHLLEDKERQMCQIVQILEQRRKTSSFELGNELFWMGRTEKGARRHVHANVSFKRTPTLRLSFSQDGTDYGQTAQSSTLSMNVGSSFQIPIGKSFRLNLPVSVSAMYDDLETYRMATGDQNDIRGWAFTPTLNPGFEIHSKNRRFYLSAGIGAALKGLYYNKLNYTKPVLNPSMGINYTFSANSKLSFSTGYTTSIGDMMTLRWTTAPCTPRRASSASRTRGTRRESGSGNCPCSTSR